MLTNRVRWVEAYTVLGRAFSYLKDSLGWSTRSRPVGWLGAGSAKLSVPFAYNFHSLNRTEFSRNAIGIT